MEARISEGLDALGLTGRVPPDAAGILAEYGRLLLLKNQVMNLTAIKDQDGVARLHMLDCAALLDLPGVDFTGKTFIDVGTGAGFPGMVLKILVPSLELTLLDSLNKRLEWLEEVTHTLDLPGVATVHARAEEAALLPRFRDRFDIAAARAVAELRVLCELCLPYVKVGGLFLAMKGAGCEAETEDAAEIIQTLGGRLECVWDYTIPGTEVKHRVAVLRKVSPTPKGYPRRWGKMKRGVG